MKRRNSQTLQRSVSRCKWKHLEPVALEASINIAVYLQILYCAACVCTELAHSPLFFFAGSNINSKLNVIQARTFTLLYIDVCSKYCTWMSANVVIQIIHYVSLKPL